MATHEGLVGLVAEQLRPVAVEEVKSHPRFKYFKEAGEDAYRSFLGVPLIDQGLLQGVLTVQTIAPRVYLEEEIRMLSEAAAQVAPVVSEARTLDRFVAPSQERLWSLARNLWWSWDHDSGGLFLDLDPVRWRQFNHNPIAVLATLPLAGIERRAQELVLHGRINYAYRRQHEYLHKDRTWGAKNAGVLRPRPSPTFPRNSACMSRSPSIRAAWESSPAITSRALLTSTFRWWGWAFSTARGISASAWTMTAGSAKSISRPMSASCPWKWPSERPVNRSRWKSIPAVVRCAPRCGG